MTIDIKKFLNVSNQEREAHQQELYFSEIERATEMTQRLIRLVKHSSLLSEKEKVEFYEIIKNILKEVKRKIYE